MIISKGENIYPARIEEILNSHPKVQECIVTGVPDSTRGECVAAYVIKADESLTVAELMPRVAIKLRNMLDQLPLLKD